MRGCPSPGHDLLLLFGLGSSGTQEPAGTRLVMARGACALAWLDRKGGLGPRVRMEARGEQQGRMTVWAAQQFLGTQGGPAAQGKSCAGSRGHC